MKKITFLVVVAVMFGCMPSFSQVSIIPKPSLNIGVELASPVGDFSETNKLGVGGSLKLAVPVASDLALTGSVGYLSFTGKDQTIGKSPAVNMIPLKAGVRFRFPGGLYFEPQLGYTNFKLKDAASSNGAFTYAANAGFLISKLDVGARYEAYSKNNNTTSFVGLRAGVNLF